MSVFTPLTKSEINAVIKNYDVGSLLSFQGVEEGVENSNFFISTLTSPPSKTSIEEFVLTLFESLDKSELDFFICLLNHLAHQKFPVPDPLKNHQGLRLIELKGKPALLAPRLSGKHPLSPTLEQCETIGSTLANMHIASADFTLHRDNDRDLKWMSLASRKLQAFLSADENELLMAELKLYKGFINLRFKLPSSVIHGDLFRDNALFIGNTLTGILDFYNACNSYSAFDLAITVNDWCRQKNGSLNETTMEALVGGYGTVRNFTQAEKEVWPIMLRFAACRFWVSRLMVKHINPPNNKEQALVKIKDPEEYEKVLRHLNDNSYHL